MNQMTPAPSSFLFFWAMIDILIIFIFSLRLRSSIHNSKNHDTSSSIGKYIGIAFGQTGICIQLFGYILLFFYLNHLAHKYPDSNITILAILISLAGIIGITGIVFGAISILSKFQIWGIVTLILSLPGWLFLFTFLLHA